MKRLSSIINDIPEYLWKGSQIHVHSRGSFLSQIWRSDRSTCVCVVHPVNHVVLYPIYSTINHYLCPRLTRAHRGSSYIKSNSHVHHLYKSSLPIVQSKWFFPGIFCMQPEILNCHIDTRCTWFRRPGPWTVTWPCEPGIFPKSSAGYEPGHKIGCKIIKSAKWLNM